MKQRSLLPRLCSVALAAMTFAVTAPDVSASPAAGAAKISAVTAVNPALIVTQPARFFDVDGVAKIRLLDGRDYPLIPLPDTVKQDLVAKSRLPLLPILRTIFTPSTVDNRGYHGPIRDQGGRGTCVSFSTTAAVEGAYRRLDMARYKDLDLSEQWANHLQKMVSLDGKGVGWAAQRENQLGCWGGSECRYLMRVLQKYGLPEESRMAYNGSGDYDKAGYDAGDPDYWRQRTADNFNLNPSNLPNTALAKAPYRPFTWEPLDQSQVRDPAVLEGLVAAGYDVVFDMALTDPTDTNADKAWIPASGDNPKIRGGHSMLIVGYNRSKEYFIVRNSWGYDNTDGGYIRISYNYLQRFAYVGCYVKVVADPQYETSRARLAIGRWQLNFDGWTGLLDIYRLPGFYQGSELNGQTDCRIGTYFASDGHSYRVNGYLWGNKLVFFIDFNIARILWIDSASAPYGSYAGTRFEAYLYSWDDQNMAGLEYQDGQVYGFHATKATPVSHVAGSIQGLWKMNHDGWKGDLSFGGPPGALTGWYRDVDGRYHEARGTLDGRHCRFWILFDTWQEFDGYVYSWDTGLMSGVTYWGGMTFGFNAARQPNLGLSPFLKDHLKDAIRVGG